LASWQVSIDVRGKRTLEESLDFYVQGELMEGDNQYLCEELGKKVRPISLVPISVQATNKPPMSGQAP
jgi:hypothetical protein